MIDFQVCRKKKMLLGINMEKEKGDMSVTRPDFCELLQQVVALTTSNFVTKSKSETGSYVLQK